MNGEPVDVLVVGAGPVGLALALDVVAHGGSVRVVERREDVPRPSRAMMVHPRTLEVLRPLGVVDELLARAETSAIADLHVRRRIVSVQLGEAGLGGTAFPHLTVVRQRDVEAVLEGALARHSVAVEWASTLMALSDCGKGPVHATVRSASGIEDVAAGFVVGCDGTASTVRRLLGVEWPGRYYPVEVVLADVELSGAVRPGRLQVAVGSAGLVFVFPAGEGAPWRLLATRERRPGTPGLGEEPVPVEELQALVDRGGLEASVDRVAWSSRIPLQHRLARRFGSGRVFLAGDAAHTQSPAAAQGMNSGIQDAANLGWKLAFAARGGLGPESALLRSYELERRPVARQVLTLTDAVFAAEASTALLPRLLRGCVLPVVAPLMPLATSQPLLMSMVLRILSQGWVHYRSSPLSVGGAVGASGLRAGDQLRDADVVCDGRRTRLHELTASPGVHVLLSRDASPGPWWPSGVVIGHRISSWRGTAVVAVRPDGHVGFTSGTGDGLADWLTLVGAEPAHHDGAVCR
jgi:2-polyprenyl-6-methoxyphenol hydroxylase-like FAD-dependent oxidoreductase